MNTGLYIFSFASLQQDLYTPILRIFGLDRLENISPLSEISLIPQIFPLPYQMQFDKLQALLHYLFSLSLSSFILHPSSLVSRLSSIVYRLSSIVYRLSSLVYRLSSIVPRLSSLVSRLSSLVIPLVL